MYPLNKNEEHEKIYKKISSLLNMKFKTQVLNGPIEFLKLLNIENLITGHKHYLLIFANKAGSIAFKDKNEFIQNFINYIDIRIDEFQDEFEKLNKFEHMSMGIKYDEKEVYMRHEEIGDGQYKLGKLKERLLKINN